MLPKFHVVLASVVSTISAHCTAIVSFVLMNGPVKIFVAATLDETMAGTLLADVSEPLYVNTLAPDSDKAVAVDDGVIGPTMFIVAADEHPNPTTLDPPTIDPDMLILAVVVDTPADVDPPVTLPVIIRDVPEKDTPWCVPPLRPGCPPVIFPIMVNVPAVCTIPTLLSPGPNVPPTTLPTTTVFPAEEFNALWFALFTAP
jgi:hypothetical protein